MKDLKIKVLDNKEPAHGFRLLSLATPWRDFEPGQFVMVKVPDNVVFLRRPFCILKATDKGIDILFKIKGKGTQRLAELKKGEEISLLGPQGRGFSVQKKGRAIIFAGGYGIAPFWSLSERLIKNNVKVEIYYGVKNEKELLFLDHFEKLGLKLFISTEDGSRGKKGYVTDRLDDVQISDDTVLYACGPDGMLSKILDFSKKKKVRSELSYETFMACGFGVCLGCAVKTKDGYKRACVDGPVFGSSEL